VGDRGVIVILVYNNAGACSLPGFFVFLSGVDVEGEWSWTGVGVEDIYNTTEVQLRENRGRTGVEQRESAGNSE
jgi:hypothetical protein